MKKSVCFNSKLLLFLDKILENRLVTLQSTLQDCSPNGIANDYTDHQRRMVESSLAPPPHHHFSTALLLNAPLL